MLRRPELVPRFATDPASARIEIAEDTRQAGFLPDERPPAEWFNWLFNTYGQWIDFLRSGGLANWTRVDVDDGGAAVALIGLAADDLTIEPAAGPIRRLVAIEAGKIWTSIRSDSWKAQGVGNISGSLVAVAFCAAGTRWLVMGSDGKVWWSWPDDGTHTTSIGNSGNNWNASTIAGALTLRGLRVGSDGAVVWTASAVYWSADGTSFAVQAFGTAPTGTLLDVVFVPASTSTPAGWVAVADDGKLYRAAGTGTATWTLLGTTLPASAYWRLEADDAGHVLAYRTTPPGTSSDLYTSSDGGQTWSTLACPAPFATTSFFEIRYLDGLWIALGNAPRVAVSNTLTATGWGVVRLPVVEAWSDRGPRHVALCEGRLTLTTPVWSYVSTRAEDTSPGPWTPGNVPADLLDSAYLRGFPIADTAPSVGDVPTWDGSHYVPTAGGGGGGGTSFSVTRTNTTGVTLAQGAPVYNGSGNINLARANASATARVLGLNSASCLAGATATILTHGVATIAASVQTGTWVDGDEIYLDDATAGKLTNVAPTTAGTFALPVGTCVGTPGGGSATLVLRVGGRIAN